MSDVISTSSYGNPGMGSCGVGIVSEGGVIGFGDEALSHISISLFHLIFMTYFLRFSRWFMVLLEFITS